MQVKYSSFVFYSLLFFSLKIVGNVFVSLSFDLASASAFTVPSHLIAEPSTVLAKYFPFSQLHGAGFQI